MCWYLSLLTGHCQVSYAGSLAHQRNLTLSLHDLLWSRWIMHRTSRPSSLSASNRQRSKPAPSVNFADHPLPISIIDYVHVASGKARTAICERCSSNGKAYDMPPEITRERLADLLVDLREDLNLEVKNWLDLQDNKRDRATFAKPALALANHGGGSIVLGFEETDEGMVEAANRPATLERYDQNLINAIVQKYCDPPFHCTVHLVQSPADAVFPVVRIPGGHRVPVRARRAGPDGKTLQQNAIYVRKPGPRSEPPRSGQEWDDLLARCLWNRRDELLDHIRGLLTGAMSQVKSVEDEERLDEWITDSFGRWSALIDPLPEGVGPRLSHGYYNFAYEIVGEVRQTSLAQLPNVIQASAVHHTGWPPFLVPDARRN